MPTAPPMTEYSFLTGGGEMAHLTRTYAWEQTPLGSPATWPQSLRTTLSMLLRSPFPMFLWWGRDLIQFYNDAYRPSLGQQGYQTWPEIWPTIKPLIDQVLAGGESP